MYLKSLPALPLLVASSWLSTLICCSLFSYYAYCLFNSLLAGSPTLCVKVASRRMQTSYMVQRRVTSAFM
uniref:Uncharacterized protein n=1 Tax=Ixodes ricinus TaxID=34613 RepID=A0A0K8RFG8_IXORI